MKLNYKFGIASFTFLHLFVLGCAEYKLDPDNIEYILGTAGTQRVIYGEDSRQGFGELPPELQEMARSTVALFSGRNLVEEKDQSLSFLIADFEEVFSLCPGERFAGEKAGSFCSGALVAPDLVLTAGHCIPNEQVCDNTHFVFDFNESPEKGDSIEFARERVFACAEIIEQKHERNGFDHALIRLDRPVMDRAPLPVATPNQVREQSSVFVLGYPSGLSVKFAGDAWVREIQEEYFVTNLDVFGGNSGSPVFDGETGAILGVLARGHRDFQYNREHQCFESVRCELDGCRGEDVSRIEPLLPLLALSM